MLLLALSRGPREPESLQRALDKRKFVECTPYLVTGGGLVAHEKQLPLAPTLRYLKGQGTSLIQPNSSSREVEPFASSVSDRYREMMEGHRRGLLVTCGKSAIHGQGAMAKRTFYPGDMVIEYVGDLIRPSVADSREKSVYDQMVGAGTYIFRLNEEHCVDATRAGNMAHLLNHSCEPNCISRTVFVDHGGGRVEEHVIIFAKFKVDATTELTYDYRFNGEEELLCNCGAKMCRGKVNFNVPGAAEEDEKDSKIRVLRSGVEWI